MTKLARFDETYGELLARRQAELMEIRRQVRALPWWARLLFWWKTR
jgi:hypothetical protein